MSRTSTITWTSALAALCVLSACPGPEVDPNNDLDGGNQTDAGPTGGEDAGETEQDAGSMDACTPLTCETAGLLCGVAPDGCGGQLNCGVCNCTPATFQTDCPSKPCETATACTNNTCVYEPITCNFEVCDSCADGSCESGELRGCGAGCPADFCDPSPSTVAGDVVYGNVCVARTAVRCGTCDLGTISCDGNGAWECQSLEIAGVDPTLIECNGASPSATVLYVDPAYTGGGQEGSKEAPFLTFDDALTAASQRGSRAIVIGGSPTFTRTITMQDGLSIYGGFGGHPLWGVDPTRRPVFEAPTSALANGRLVGVSASNITTPTELAGVDVKTPHLNGSGSPAGAINVGAHVVSSPGLRFRDVRFTVGDAQAGAKGTSGAPVNQVVIQAGYGANAQSKSSGGCQGLSPTAGGAAGYVTCGGMTAANSLGGLGASTPVPLNNADDGFVKGGNAPTGAQGGLASYNGTFSLGPGQDGAPWTSPAMTGATPPASLLWVGDYPVPQGRGDTGAAGQLGRGGGGGSSGFRYQGFSGGDSYCRVGGGGGGGGAGGCGGNPGTGGYPGGWSIGVIAVGATAPTFEGVEITLGLGGAGGFGGTGGTGGPGASGGKGGSSSGLLNTYTGSEGGKGAAGQQGGTGGAGAAGQSVGVLCANGAAVNLNEVSSMGTGGTFSAAQGCN